MFSSLAPVRRRLVLGVIGGLIVAALTSVAIGLAARGDAPRKPAGVQKPGPVVLVPGYGGSTGSLDALAAVLRTNGRDARVMPLPGDGRGDLTEQAKALAAEVTELRHQTGAGSVDVVGYSAGGVVARLWVRDYGGARIARRVVTLGSPHHGTNLAGLAGVLLPDACPVACQQLEPGSSLLTALNAGNETPLGPQFVSIWTTDDDVVIPPDSATLIGALDLSVQSVCASSRVTHSDLPSDRVVKAMVVRELGAGPPMKLTAADCASL